MREKFGVENPALLQEWDYEKNSGLNSHDYTSASNKKVWWKCAYAHSWKAPITRRTKGAGCPYCSGRYAIHGVNDLQTVNPTLSLEWDCNKNGELRPCHVKHKSNKKVWWICEKGHSWQTSVSSRTSGNGCPYCAGLYVLHGFSDLKTLNPKLAIEWDYEKNGDLKPTDVAHKTHKKVWWKCDLGHSWQAAIYHRSNGTGCPVCRGLKILTGFNDLATIAPHLVSEWDFEKNGELNPYTVSPGSHRKVWWHGVCGHTWDATIYERVNGTGCPICRGLKVLSGVNDLQTLLPSVAAEWDCERNDSLTPTDVVPGSERKVWWKCIRGHHWRSGINTRKMGHGCPYCWGQFQMRSRLVR